MFLGVAIGDALYRPVETYTAEQIRKKYGWLTTYVSPENHKWFKDLTPGKWTDDTQLTLLVADSLIDQRAFHIWDLADRHVEYLKREGDLGFGKTTREAIQRLSGGEHWSRSGITDKPGLGLGNGLPMKIAPLAAFSLSPYFRKWSYHSVLFDTNLRDFTLMTHYTWIAVESTMAHIRMLQLCLDDDNWKSDYNFPETIVSAMRPPSEQERKLVPYGAGDDLKLAISSLNQLDSHSGAKDFIRLYGAGSAYVYHTLPFCYAFFLKNPTSINTLYEVGNAGGDTDTNASIVGGMLGALNGASIFPPYLIDALWQKERVIDTANRFYDRLFSEEES